MELPPGLKAMSLCHESLLGVLIPEVVDAVCAGRGEGGELFVESDGVDGVDVDDGGLSTFRVAVAFEGKVAADIFRIDVVDGDAAFDGADGEALAVRKGRDASRLMSQRRLLEPQRLLPIGARQVKSKNFALGSSDD